MVMDLITSYQLLKHYQPVQSQPASEDRLLLVHSSDYLDLLRRINSADDSADLDGLNETELEEYGLSCDCVPVPRIYDLVCELAGGSALAAKVLVSSYSRVVVNWFGGWHHAQRDKAEGFCYVNDVAIAIQILLDKKFKKVLYLDLDIHHGNGVQNIFELSKKVLTLSFHKHCPGFYPGTGCLNDLGYQDARYYALNVPFLDGLSDATLVEVFDKVFPRVVEVFSPEALVIQCGADGLAGDRLGECNLTLESIGHCVKYILGTQLPTIFLGGGGYNFPNTARLWTYLTAIICGQTIDNDIPDESDFYPDYAPSYELSIEPGRCKDLNSDDYKRELVETLYKYCDEIEKDNYVKPKELKNS